MERTKHRGLVSPLAAFDAVFLLGTKRAIVAESGFSVIVSRPFSAFNAIISLRAEAAVVAKPSGRVVMRGPIPTLNAVFLLGTKRAVLTESCCETRHDCVGRRRPNDEKKTDR